MKHVMLNTQQQVYALAMALGLQKSFSTNNASNTSVSIAG
jgi:hypothetical protein